MHGPVAARRDDAVEAEPQRQGVTAEGKRHGFAGQRLGFAVEQSLGGARRVVSAPLRLAGGIARLPFHEMALCGPLYLNLQVGFRHRRISLVQIYHRVFQSFLSVTIPNLPSTGSCLVCMLVSHPPYIVNLATMHISFVVCA